MLSELLSNFARDWLNATTLLEVGALAVATLAAWAASRAVGPPPPAPPGTPNTAQSILREAGAVAAPYLSALIVLLVVRAFMSLKVADTRLLDQCLTLFGWLIVIRGITFLVRVSLGPHTRLRTWELRLALLVWFFVAMQVLGLLGSFTSVLNGIELTPATKGSASLTLWSLIRALFTVIAFVLLSAWTGRWLERRLATLVGLAPGTRIAVAKFAYAFLIGFGVLLGLSASGLNLGALSIFGGALGLGLGFGLQAIAANFVSGFVLLMDKSIKPGDVISFTGTIGTSTEGFGWVQELRGRYVVVRDRDGVETLVPNQNLITNQVINWSYSDKRVRLKLPVRISYDDDPEVAMQVLLEAANCSPRILRDMPPVARLMSFHDYGLDLELRFWIADPEAGVNNVRSDVNRSIWRLFKERGITIPRAQLDVRMYDADGRIIGQGALPARRAIPQPVTSGGPGSAPHGSRSPTEG